MFGKITAKFFAILGVLVAGCNLQLGSPAPATTPLTDIGIDAKVTIKETPGKALPVGTPFVAPTPEASSAPTPSPTPTPKIPDVSTTRLGITYSFPHATWLFGGFDQAKAALDSIGCGFGVKHYRLEAYWNWLQDDSSASLKTSFNIDWQLDTAKRCGAESVVMCVGRKVPHWPEYHVPGWAKDLSEAQLKASLLDYEQRIVRHYGNDARVTHWQIENEPFLSFGDGSPFEDQEDFIKKEVKTVRDADALKRPIIITESGDLGDWEKSAALGEILGVTFYGISYENGAYFDHTERNGPPSKWGNRAKALGKPVWLIEMQAEPWGPGSVKDLTPDEARKSMNPQRFFDHLNYVVDAGFTDINLWGAEWWLYEKQRGRPEMWEAAEKIFAQR